MRLTRAVAQIEPQTNGTQLYCTWRPSGLATGLHGQEVTTLVKHKFKAAYILGTTLNSNPQR